MRKLVCLIGFAFLTACGGGGGGGTGGGVVPPDPDPIPDTTVCSNDWQKQFVLDNLYTWYLWNDLLPANIDIANYASPEELASLVTREFGPQDANGNPIDRFSSVGSAQADAEFFGEGKYRGFGFRWRFEGPDMRMVNVYANSPAGFAGLDRGQTVVSLNGRTVADIDGSEGISAFFDNNETVTFVVEDVSGGQLPPIQIMKDIVTIDPVPQWRVIDAGNGRNVGYMELSTFISTANPIFDTVFAEFRNAGVNDVILDLRYNGGGLVSTANLLGDYLGGLIAENLVYSRTEFNADRAAVNNSTEFFDRLGNSMSLSRLVVVASRSTASASELVTNGMIPHVEVAIVGDRTFGKPVGQIGLEFCEKILRPTSFRIANADGAGDYFDGLPLTAGCAAADDLSVAIGEDQDPNMVAAMEYLDTGACAAASVPGSQFKTGIEVMPLPLEENLPPEREFLNAY